MSENNPLGIIDFDHLEFTCDSFSTKTRELFYKQGFIKTAISDSGHAELFSQGQIKFLLTKNSDKDSHSRKYLNAHGEGVSKISFKVKDCEYALKKAIERGAEALGEIVIVDTEFGPIKTACIKGFGDVRNEFVERPAKIWRAGFTFLDTDSDATPLNVRCSRIDHLTNNVPYGEMEKWVEFYCSIYGFKVTRYFDIKGEKTGLISKVVQSEDNKIIIPINQPNSPDGQDQISEFLEEHKGAGVQHIAFMTPDAINTVSELAERGMNFLEIPHTYYQDIPNRPFSVDEDPEVLEKAQLLVDGDSDGYLLQNFTKTYIGPLFFEYIQRKNHWGFGEGNFQALFNSIERDQVERGYLK
jgi:4-hydroxyphenylpyruvate dioxygenase